MKDFVIRPCTDADLNDILDLQEATVSTLPSQELLRKNTPEMLRLCLHAPHLTMGAWHQGTLAAISVLYVPDDGEENLMKSLRGVDTAGKKSVNYKLCIVAEAYRGNHLQYELATYLLDYAVQQGAHLVCATASPKNVHSIRNMESLGFLYNRTLEKYGYERNLYYRFLSE